MDRFTSMQLFIRLVDSGSFSRTAQDMNLSQPTVTKHIAAIEARLGVRLLNRNTRGMRLTEAGMLFYERCKIIQREVETADDMVTRLGERINGRLRVASSSGFGRRVVMPLAQEFMAGNPGVQFDLQFDDHMIDLVEHGIDVSVRMGKLADSTLGSRCLGVNPWVTVASPAYLARCGEPAHPSSLADHACIVYSSVQGDHLWHYADEKGAPIAVTVSGPLRANNISCVASAALDGIGIALLPQYIARRWIIRGTLNAILRDFPLPSQEIHAVYPSPRMIPAKVSAWIGFLQAQFAKDAWIERDWNSDDSLP